jgi:hypothetical protein
MDSKVFWSVLGALCAFAFILVLASSFEREMEAERMNAAIAQIFKVAAQPAPASVYLHASAQGPMALPRTYLSTFGRIVPPQDSAADEAQRERRRLGPDDLCVGGKVVRKVGSVYSQVGATCLAGYANVPLR